jgi:hypothetical protein
VKKRTALTLTAILLLGFLLVVAGCEALQQLSIEKRIDEFLSDLNTDTGRTRIYKNLHPDIRAAWQAPATWSTSPLRAAYAPFSFTSMTYGDNYAEGDITSGGPNDTIYFEMMKDGSD